MDFPTRVDYFVSRVLHMLSAGLLVGTAAVPFLYRNAEVQYPRSFMIWALVVIATGLYNAQALQPSRMGSNANVWRFIVYGLKIGMTILMSPLLDKIAGDFAPHARLGLSVAAVASGSYCRYYREKYQAPK
eukprot:TRINITY_DN5577_c0_g1_i1.p1 TRINITY_DN5577_c0_g1~~TRINITY_DN5577_c0_g1_i1.p1  ORF type:complete len:131 (+),score=28.09 TRINITY_DN5577_c0_g1_i1:148-540(+)